MTDAFVETPAEPATDWMQLFAAILLGLAATLTALSAYQAALKDGDALKGYTQSSRTLSDANAFYAQGGQTYALDQQLFVAYATANQTEDSDLAPYLLELMRPELKEAIDWWADEKNEATTPFVEAEGNPYTVADTEEAQALEEKAGEQFDVGAAADDVGDKFELATVFFALTLFFGGVATLFSRRAVSLALLVAGVVTLLVGSTSLFSAL
ncbi:MAG: hypothetical protein JWO60_435 [Frankiales bacterium]|nr:hypothetical protein [Frankiales bacterium]